MRPILIRKYPKSPMIAQTLADLLPKIQRQFIAESRCRKETQGLQTVEVLDVE
jgi:hypothetical protein